MTRLTNRQKHAMAVQNISSILTDNEVTFVVSENNSEYDLIANDEKKIKVFCNHSGAKKIKVSKDFAANNDVYYIVYKPTNNNTVGYTAFGGNKERIESAVIDFPTKDSPKNIEVNKLRSISLKKLARDMKDL